MWEVMHEYGRPSGPLRPDERRFNVAVSTFLDPEEAGDE